MGAGLARGGLGRRTALGTLTLIVGANLPDVDVLAYLWGPAADVAFRRGWTHGVLALALWPFVLAAAMLGLERVVRRVRPSALRSPAVPRQLLFLAAVSIISHPILDTLNTYGVRWLMPFSGRWFYGDTLFIVDPWLWLVLGVGLLLSRRRTGPARLALGVAAAYVVAMAVGAVAARRVAAAELAAARGAPVGALMLSPLPATPFARRVVAAEDDGFVVGPFRWLERPRIGVERLRAFEKGDPGHPAVVAAAATTVGRRFLTWARFPSYRVEPAGTDRFIVHIVDLRYADRPGVRFGAVSIPVALPGPLSARPE